MRTWIAAHAATTCGYCGGNIPAGEPVQLVYLVGVQVPRFRCQAHAYGPVDWEKVQASKSSHAQTSRQPAAFERLSRIRSAFDPKKAQIAEGDE